MYKFLIISFLFISCKSENFQKTPNLTLENIPANTKINYDSCKRKIDTIRNDYKTLWETIPAKEREKVFTEAITKTIIPAWVGTQWAYSGTTEIPQQGNIACGSQHLLATEKCKKKMHYKALF